MDAAFEKIMAAGWLGTIAPGLRQGFQNALKLKEFASGSEVYAFEQDQPCLWGVASGGVHLFVAMNEQLPTLAHIAGPGAWFGDAHVVLGDGRAVRVTSFGASSHQLSVDSNAQGRPSDSRGTCRCLPFVAIFGCRNPQGSGQPEGDSD